MWTKRSAAGAILLAALALVSTTCSVDKSKFQSQLYTCDLSADVAVDGGVGPCGAGFGCYGASRQLGTPDFCAPTCTPPAADGTVCTEGYQLQKCSPSAPVCPQGMACIRQNVFADDGLCLPLSTCAVDTDCRDPVRNSCFSSFLTAGYPGRTDMRTNHLFCFQQWCSAHQTACEPGTVCLPDVLSISMMPTPDVCTPNCDSLGRCPPTFICSKNISFFRDQASFCLPGLDNFPCRTDLDCIIGSCISVGADAREKVCAAPCTKSEDCAPFDNPANSEVSYCSGGHCLSPKGLGLTQFCHGDPDCPAGQICRFQTEMTVGACVQPCTVIGPNTCPKRGSLPQWCIPFINICGVAEFAAPCQTAADCAQGLDCLPKPNAAYKECTVACTDNNEMCTTNRLTRTSTRCQNGVCDK